MPSEMRFSAAQRADAKSDGGVEDNYTSNMKSDKMHTLGFSSARVLQ
jgi:hypothetical protein